MSPLILLIAVSYTHLDVYKRQTIHFLDWFCLFRFQYNFAAQFQHQEDNIRAIDHRHTKISLVECQFSENL